MAEWSNAVDSKSIVLFNGVPRVQIPISPPILKPLQSKGFLMAKRPFQASLKACSQRTGLSSWASRLA